MRPLAIAIPYAALFATSWMVPPDLVGIFLSVYFTVILISVALPLRGKEPDALRASNIYKGLMGGIFGALLTALYLEFIFPLLHENQTKTVGMIAATWVLFSLMLIVGSLVSVSRLGTLLVKNRPHMATNQEGSPIGAQHFALEYCTLHWFRHSKYLGYSLAITGMFLYGWFLLGLPYFTVSVPLLISAMLSVRSIARSFLLPFTIEEVLSRVEQKGPKTK
jgi:hypothetical protein